jgi:hypothetical protein
LTGAHDEGVPAMSAELHLFMRGYEDSDAQERAELAGQLASQLHGISVVRHPPATDPPASAKGTALEWASLIVTLVGTLPVTVQAIQSWLDRRGRRTSVTLRLGEDEITLESPSDAEQRELLRQFLERHDSD